MLTVHRLVLLAFEGLPAIGLEARHLDDVPSNNHIKNLKWGTIRENRADAIRNGGQVRGVAHGKAVLDDEKVLAMRSLRLQGATYPGIAKKFGVNKTTASRAIKGQTWSHVRRAGQASG